MGITGWGCGASAVNTDACRVLISSRITSGWGKAITRYSSGTG